MTDKPHPLDLKSPILTEYIVEMQAADVATADEVRIPATMNADSEPC